ncbi:MAG: hypothetical protein L0271_12045 [Gemmatimonadetes bacterium]|nr:hypothetical protein [Gemmatimonadota bacterium]
MIRARSCQQRDGAPAVIDAVRAVRPDIEMQWTSTLAESLELPARVFRGVAIGFVLAGAIALALSMLSLYALMSFAVTRRRREIGIRVAMGAPAGSIVASVLGRGLRQMLVGTVPGIALGAGLARIAIAAIPFDLVRGGPAELIVIGVILTGTGFAACAGPLRRTLGVDPIGAIRPD